MEICDFLILEQKWPLSAEIVLDDESKICLCETKKTI